MVMKVELDLMASAKPPFLLLLLVLLPMQPSWQLLQGHMWQPVRRKAASYLEGQVEATPSSKINNTAAHKKIKLNPSLNFVSREAKTNFINVYTIC